MIIFSKSKVKLYMYVKIGFLKTILNNINKKFLNLHATHHMYTYQWDRGNVIFYNNCESIVDVQNLHIIF